MNAFLSIASNIMPTAELLAEAGAIVIFDQPDGSRLVPSEDLYDVQDIQLLNETMQPDIIPLFDIPHSDPGRVLLLPGGARLISQPGKLRDARTGAHLRSVLIEARRLGPRRTFGNSTVPLSGGWKLSDASTQLAASADETAKVFRLWNERSERDFANSAGYMGSKRVLLPFLMQTLSSWLPDDSTFVDLMCGSGSVAGAAANVWPTVASDAQLFCTKLAAVQSGGYTYSRALAVLDELQDHMTANAAWLSERVSGLLAMEDILFQSSLGLEDAAEQYKEFIQALPTYPRQGHFRGWDPNVEVAARQAAPPFSMPSCLFTAYYSDLYVGIRQAVEIDSVRHAIAHLCDPLDRDWALGALVVAASKIATSYAGHFAQPMAPAKRLNDPKLFAKVAAWRTMSVVLEFEKRLLSLARESESVRHAAKVVDGPWPIALDRVYSDFPGADITVYVDAPYRRDEYSRYYHLLETLVKYDYPRVGLPARVPEKRLGYRFASEFFTRSRPLMAQALADVLTDVLRRGWRCAWSYADDADASVSEVIAALAVRPARARAVAAEHIYQWQGGHKRSLTGPKIIRELLLLIEP